MSKKWEENVALVLQYGGLRRLGVHKSSEVLRKQALVTVFGNWMACSISMQNLWSEVTSCFM
jgi:hypothetical protein